MFILLDGPKGVGAVSQTRQNERIAETRHSGVICFHDHGCTNHWRGPETPEA
jgi:hypothetical protein